MSLKAWISKKQNQRLFLFVMGFVLVYYWIKNRDKSVDDQSVYRSLGGRTATPTEAPISTDGYMYYGISLPYTYTPKELFTLFKNGSLYSDNFSGDYIADGVKKINANGRTYTAFYYINEIPFSNLDGTPKIFRDVALPVGQFITIRKVYAQSSWVSTFDQLFNQGYEAWFENLSGDENRTYKVVMVNITT